VDATASPPRAGRRRGFDRAEALELAMFEFWRRGFDGVSVAELTAEIGIAAPSLYAAFGDKRQLFREAVDAYQGTFGGFFEAALAAEPTVRLGVHRALRAAAIEYTRPERPRGCLVLSAAVACAGGSADIEALLRERREANLTALRDRIEADQAVGLLARHASADTLARFTGAVLQGMSQQARDGATTDELLTVADAAMAAWPSSGPGSALV
jgi:AcrR family transcriptional regulator